MEIIVCAVGMMLSAKGEYFKSTAVVITPVHKLVDKPFLESEEETVYTYGDGKCGPKSLKLYNYITALQKGEIEDEFGWIVFI